MSGILNNTTACKTVTFRDPIPEPRVGRVNGDVQQSPKTVLHPRVVGHTSSVHKAAIDKPLHRPPITGPTTRSKYAQAIADIVRKGGGSTKITRQMDMINFAQAILDDDP